MWLCVRFALLPLESLWGHSETTPVAVGEQQRLVCCNAMAYQKGVRPGQSVATAYAVADSLQVVERREHLEQQQLKKMALQLYPFSPVLTLWQPDKLLVEIGRSLTLFHGLDPLLSRIRSAVAQHHMTACFGLGPTPKAAELFSYLSLSESYPLWNTEQQAFDNKAFLALVDLIAINLLPLPEKLIDKISATGIKTIGGLRVLSTAALNKRFGRELVLYLQQLTGEHPDVQTCFQPQIEFTQSLEFIDVIHQREALLFPMRRLLEDLIYFLRLYQKSGQLLRWKLRDSYQVASQFDVHLSDAQVDFNRFLELTRLQLDSVNLTGPIEWLELSMPRLVDADIQEQSLFSRSEPFNDELHFVSKIKARLGYSSCLWLVQKNEVIPELSCSLLSDQPSDYSKQRQSQVQSRRGSRSLNVSSSTQQKQSLQASEQNTMMLDGDLLPQQKIRPSWLLPVPQAIGRTPERLNWQGKLRLVSQPERLFHHWWKKPVSRDYYVAQHESGIFYWVFYDQLKQGWFVQGVFS